jgi:outer membrane lipoprotein SlyB
MIKFILTLAAAFILTGCATATAVQKTNLEVETKMSSSIFLEPVEPEAKTIYVQVRNTSDQPSFNIENNVIQALRARGYLVTNDPKRANYMLQANVLSVGETNKRTRDQLMTEGFGSAAIGGVVGAGIGALSSGHNDALIGGALAGAALGTILNASFKDVTYSVVTDVQVSQRLNKAITSKTTTTLNQGDSSKVASSVTQSSEWDRYQTRVVSTANKANLKLEDAMPQLVDGLSLAVAGIF